MLSRELSCCGDRTAARLRMTVSMTLAAMLVSGCADSRNRENGLIGVDPSALPALHATSRSSIPDNDTPSVTGLNRRDWTLTLIAVPRGQVEVQPTYGRNLHLASGPARATGIFPTVATALETGASTNSLVAEGAVQPLWFPVSLAWSPLLMSQGECPLSTRREPCGRYETTPKVCGDEIHGSASAPPATP